MEQIDILASMLQGAGATYMDIVFFLLRKEREGLIPNGITYLWMEKYNTDLSAVNKPSR